MKGTHTHCSLTYERKRTAARKLTVAEATDPSFYATTNPFAWALLLTDDNLWCAGCGICRFHKNVLNSTFSCGAFRTMNDNKHGSCSCGQSFVCSCVNEMMFGNGVLEGNDQQSCDNSVGKEYTMKDLITRGYIQSAGQSHHISNL